ncbi:MAG: hypothetical protein A3J38_09315 [Gammaproteobacteria bacterium RIFCSPHIGHO2_12_FULL_45_9]|nr:MAG: hypothetical protein A3J38_09315 [Gammaproteobacteria bacterium RIFCSPHIGHO2_12_FULL_45_9]
MSVYKKSGYTLIEVLLALSVIALLMGFSIERYRQYQTVAVSTSVQGDVAQIFTALNQYFMTTGCTSDGSFQGSFTPDLGRDLGLNALALGRSPIIMYTPTIVKSSITTATGKPLYQLQVAATLKSTISYAEKMQDAGLWHATINTDGDLLFETAPASLLSRR